jgi:hypothetical protein
MFRSLPMFGALAILALLWGCGSDTVTRPTPQAPKLLNDDRIGVNQDTTDSRTSHLVSLVFVWETDIASTDVLFYGPHADSLRDSLVAENVDTPLGGTTVHVHQAPASTASPLHWATSSEVFYRVRMRSKDPAAPVAYSPIERFPTFDPNINKPVQVLAGEWRASAGR